MKQLAPYGQHLQSLSLESSAYEIVIIFMGKEGKERAKSLLSYIPSTLYLPQQFSPHHFYWPLINSDVYLIDTGKSQFSFVRFCALTFFGEGANVVNYISPARSFIFRKGL